MCANVRYKVVDERDVFNRQGCGVPRHSAEDAAALGPGRWSSRRTHGSKASLDAFMRREPPAAVRVPVAYCRVSSSAQKPDLKNQRRVVENFCATHGVANVEYVEEVCCGLNLKRPKFVALMDRIEARQVSHLVIAHKDRLLRFGFSWFERVL
jgi:hypothetical protein